MRLAINMTTHDGNFGGTAQGCLLVTASYYDLCKTFNAGLSKK